MGFLASLFGRDWAVELEKVERDLANDDPVLALDRARKVAKGAPEGGLRDRAQRLVAEAMAASSKRAQARAEASEREGLIEDAIDWIGAALANEDAPVVRAEFEAWRARLAESLDRGRSPLLGSRAGAPIEDEPGGGADDDEEDALDPEWEAWVATLRDDMAERWLHAPEGVAFAVCATNSGGAEEALEELDRVSSARQSNPVVCFERARAYLALSRFAEAEEALEVAWRELGSAPLDLVGSVSIPAMWAEAQFGLERPENVVQRLSDLADPKGDGGMEPALAHAHALSLTGEWEAADMALARLMRFNDKDSRLPLERATMLAHAGRLDEAIRVLDAAVAPTCRPGCGSPPHLPSVRALAGFLLDQGQDIERAQELLVVVAHRNGGAFSAQDHELLARYYDAAGDPEAAEEARAAAAEIVGLDIDAAQPVLMPAGRRRVL